MENNDCEQITKVMRECVSKNHGTYNCKEIIKKFDERDGDASSFYSEEQG